MMLSKHDKHLKGSAEFLPPRPPPPTPKIRPASNTSGTITFELLFFKVLLCPKRQNTQIYSEQIYYYMVVTF